MTARLVGRTVAGLVLLVTGLVLVPAGTAVACSCVTDQPAQLVENAEVAFIGVLESQRSDDDDVAHRFTVESVFAGAAHHTQDVVTPRQGQAGCGVEWETGARMVVLGYEDEQGRVAANLCTGSTTSADASYALLLAALGGGAAPAPGEDMAELDRWRREDLRWFSLAVGVIGLAALGVIARRRWGSRG